MARQTRRWRRAASTAARAAAALVESAWSAPGLTDPAAVVAYGGARLQPGRPLRVLCWNIQFCAGRDHHFFYDGGPDVHVDPSKVYENLDAIAAVIRAEEPDLVLLQEVDRRSDRTGRIDQHAELLARAPFPCHTSAAYHRNRFVPHPAHRPLGRMDLHLSVFSRSPITEARRIALAPVVSGTWLRRQFDLRRALLEVDLPLGDGRVLRVGNVHLSAFTRGDGTLAQQVARVHDRLSIARRQGHPMLVGGDFNALPPDIAPETLGELGREYGADRQVLSSLFTDFQAAVGLEAHHDAPERWRTYLPPGQSTADRAVDHVFVDQIDVLDTAVLTAHHGLSDHLPQRIELEVSPTD